jgi:hypothetical protein
MNAQLNTPVVGAIRPDDLLNTLLAIWKFNGI